MSYSRADRGQMVREGGTGREKVNNTGKEGEGGEGRMGERGRRNSRYSLAWLQTVICLPARINMSQRTLVGANTHTHTHTQRFSLMKSGNDRDGRRGGEERQKTDREAVKEIMRWREHKRRTRTGSVSRIKQERGQCCREETEGSAKCQPAFKTPNIPQYGH